MTHDRVVHAPRSECQVAAVAPGPLHCSFRLHERPRGDRRAPSRWQPRHRLRRLTIFAHNAPRARAVWAHWPVNLVDPDTLSVTSIAGFSVTDNYSGGHDDGATSVDEGGGTLYVTDRTNRMLFAVDPNAQAITGSVPLGGPPDYVRFVAATNELWVTEPGLQQLEIFKLGVDGVPVPDGAIPIENGPESLVIDEQRGRAYTHRWQKTTLAIDVQARSIVAEWPNACASSRGLALDEARGIVFASCVEGTAAALDVGHDGQLLSTMERGSGFDVIGYSTGLGHLYLAGGSCSCLVTLSVDAGGRLSFLDRADAPSSTHCVVPDDVGHAWVCDPDGGQLFRVDDRLPGAAR